MTEALSDRGDHGAGMPGATNWRARVVGYALGDAADTAVERGRVLIAAASRVIMRSGGSEFTVQNVAAEAGVSVRALYRHFEGRDDLLIALLEESNLVYARLLGDHVARFEDPLERLGAALYFATDARQHTDSSYNAALARFAIETSLTSPDAAGRARTPVVEIFTDLVSKAIDDGQLHAGDPRELASMLVLTLTAFEHCSQGTLGVGASPPAQDVLVRYGIQGLGGKIPPGWERRFHLTDDQAAASKARTEELSGVIRRAAPSNHKS